MTPRVRAKAYYKVLTGIVIAVCVLNLVFVVPYFDTEEREDVDVSVFSTGDEFNEKNVEKMHKEDTTYSDFVYHSLNWPILKSEHIFQTMFNSHHFWWISERVQSLWPQFEQHASKIKQSCNETSKKKILILPGVLVFTNFASREVIKRGGSLGELTQWADLIAGSIALCHYVNVKTNFRDADAYLKKKSAEGEESGCSGREVDLIFTDITGIKKLSPEVVEHYKKKFRILDVFGTEAAFNDVEFAEVNRLAYKRWAGLNLHLKQFCTMFPHTPDNSFLGFVISSSSFISHQKQNYSLILGKEASYLKGKMELLETIHEFFPVAVTMHQRSLNLLPQNALILGIVDPAEYYTLISEAKVCIGLGNPIESPSPLLSLAAGCIFLNPMKNLTLHGKPTHRKITSQHDYLERYVKPPHVFTYDMSDLKKLKAILEVIQKIGKVDPIIPKAFTVYGFLERLEHTILSRNFCTTHKHLSSLPPLRAFLAKDSKDCKDLCYRQGLICEPDYFVQINNLSYIKSLGVKCRNSTTTRDLYTPAYDNVTHTCHLQPSDNPLFSCVGTSIPGLLRICPCITDTYGEIVTPKKYQMSHMRAFAMP